MHLKDKDEELRKLTQDLGSAMAREDAVRSELAQVTADRVCMQAELVKINSEFKELMKENQLKSDR